MWFDSWSEPSSKPCVWLVATSCHEQLTVSRLDATGSGQHRDDADRLRGDGDAARRGSQSHGAAPRVWESHRPLLGTAARSFPAEPLRQIQKRWTSIELPRKADLDFCSIPEGTEWRQFQPVLVSKGRCKTCWLCCFVMVLFAVVTVSVEIEMELNFTGPFEGLFWATQQFCCNRSGRVCSQWMEGFCTFAHSWEGFEGLVKIELFLPFTSFVDKCLACMIIHSSFYFERNVISSHLDCVWNVQRVWGYNCSKLWLLMLKIYLFSWRNFTCCLVNCIWPRLRAHQISGEAHSQNVSGLIVCLESKLALKPVLNKCLEYQHCFRKPKGEAAIAKNSLLRPIGIPVAIFATGTAPFKPPKNAPLGVGWCDNHCKDKRVFCQSSPTQNVTLVFLWLCKFTFVCKFTFHIDVCDKLLVTS